MNKEDCKIILKNSSILLAEDEDRVRESFKRVLELYVKKVICAKDGLEALEIFKQERTDIIFSDVKMPKLNGINFIKEIRKTDKYTPIVITSAYSDRDFLLESIKLSLVEYLMKPIKEEKLLEVLKLCAQTLVENRNDKINITQNSSYDFTNKTFLYKNKPINLTNKEVQFIELLLLNRGHLVTKSTLEAKLYIYDEAPPSALKNLVFKLRKKIEKNIIKTCSSLGYMIESS